MIFSSNVFERSFPLFVRTAAGIFVFFQRGGLQECNFFICGSYKSVVALFL